MLYRQACVIQRKLRKRGAPDWLVAYLGFALERIARRKSEYEKLRRSGAITYPEYQHKYGVVVAELCGVIDVMDAFLYPRLKP